MMSSYSGKLSDSLPKKVIDVVSVIVLLFLLIYSVVPKASTRNCPKVPEVCI